LAWTPISSAAPSHPAELLNVRGQPFASNGGGFFSALGRPRLTLGALPAHFF